MYKSKGKTAERFKFAKVLSLISVLSAHADEVVSGTETVTQEERPVINYEQLIAQARKEEKDKLYPRIKQLEDDNRKHIQIENDNFIKIGDLTQMVNTLSAELAKYKSGEVPSKDIEDLKAKVEALEKENAELKEKSVDEISLRATIEKEYEIKSYLAEQKMANKDKIISSFLDKVQGTTKEEIDNSIQSAIEESLNIKKELGLVDEKGNPVSKTNNKRETKKTSAPRQPKTLNPAETTGESPAQFDAEYIRNLDPSSEEYKEFRKSIGLRA